LPEASVDSGLTIEQKPSSRPDLQGEANRVAKAVMDTANGVSASPSMGSKSLASSYSSDYSFNRALPLSLKRRGEFGGGIANAVISPRGSGGDPSSKCLAIRVGGAGAHKISGLLASRPSLPNGDNISHGATRGSSRVDGPSMENTTISMS
jgi:hypothetical protein